MDLSSEIPRKSKRRFQPRHPPPPSHKPITPTSNTEAEAENESRKAAQQIARRIRMKHKTETKASSSTDVTFQSNSSLSLATRSFGVAKEDSDMNPSEILLLPTVSSSVTTQKDREEVDNSVTRSFGVTKEDDKQDSDVNVLPYVEHWDYENSYYPTVLPLRKPYSGDPELLDQEEFGEVAKHPEYDEKIINSAEELGLKSEDHCKKQMFFFKIPDCLPVMKQSTEANTKKPISSNQSSKRSNPFEGLPEGFMGKMLVYKSGNVKLKLGDVLFDVMPGTKTQFPNDVAAIDIEGRRCCRVGSSAKHVTVTPDIKYLLESDSDMETQK